MQLLSRASLTTSQYRPQDIRISECRIKANVLELAPRVGHSLGPYSSLFERGLGSMANHDRTDLFQGFDDDRPAPQARNALKSALIAGYEHALEQGMTPSHALAVILSWAAEECDRLHADVRR